MIKPMPRLLILKIAPFVCVLCLASGCLKTRAQLRDDNANPTANNSGDNSPPGPGSTPVPAKVQDVQLQGSYAIDEIKAEMTRLQGRIEDLEHAQAQAQKDQSSTANKDQIQKMQDRLTALEQAQEKIIQQLQKIQDAQTAASINPEDELESGKSSMESGSFEVAIDHFSNSLKTAKDKTAEDATYLRGESYYQLKQYKKAIIDYSKFPEKFTKSKYMSRALLRIGQSFEALGMNEDAKGFYQELLDKFPKSKEAKQVHLKLR
jgi:TolA-binding protein